MASLLRKKQEKVNMLSDGIRLTLSESGQTKDRRWTLLLKGIIVYLIVMGTMGSLLSSLEADCNWGVIAVVLFLGAMFCSFLYYSKKWENIGYILLFVMMLFFGMGLRAYISSGVYAVANDLQEAASTFFESNASQTFVEQVANRRLAVTVSMCYIGWVACMLVNVWISLHMRYLISGIVSFAVLSLAIYIEAIPNVLFVAMLITGLLMGYILFRNGHFRPVHNNQVYQYVETGFGKKKTARITYAFSPKISGMILAAVFVVTFAVLELFTIICPQDYYRKQQTASPLKAETMDTVENLTLMGIWAFFNYYPSTGGLTNGTLGGINAVQLDYEPDLEVVYTPYTTERIYFKTFTGATYLPYQNQWERLTDENGQMREEPADETTQTLMERYEAGESTSARGVMEVTNLAAYTGVYLPYYSQGTGQVIWPNRTEEYVYYPYFPQESMGLSDEVDDAYLYVPQENVEVIAEFCAQAGLEPGETQDVTAQLTTYYQDNIPYTLRPGATQRKKDFVNYFLAENQRGYCAHFASAATLIFRYLGIPARYVEGYALDMADLAEEGKPVYDKEYADYYDGYSMFGPTNVMSVSLTDANAHAWVEVYDADTGWQPVEVTPSSDEEEIASGFWRVLMNFMGGDSDAYQTGGASDTAGTEAVINAETGLWAGRILVLILLAFTLIIGIRMLVLRIRKWHAYQTAGINDQLIALYRNYIRRVGRRDKEILKKHNYREQLAWLTAQGYLVLEEKEQTEWLRILEQAGFSNTEISPEEKEKIANRLKCIKKND